MRESVLDDGKWTAPSFLEAVTSGKVGSKYSEVLWAGMLMGGVGSLLAVTPL